MSKLAADLITIYFNKVILVLPALCRHPHRVVRNSSWAEGEKGLCRLCFDKSRHPATKISDFFFCQCPAYSHKEISRRRNPWLPLLCCRDRKSSRFLDFQILGRRGFKKNQYLGSGF